MSRRRPRTPFAGVVVALICAGTLLSGCSRTELSPAPEVVPAAPQLFDDGTGITVTTGSSGPDATAGGPLWWFTDPEGELSVHNGSDQDALVRVSADVLVPCQTSARVELTLPGGHSTTVEAAPDRPGRVRFAVSVPSRGAVEVGVRIEASACRPPHDSRTLYAGLGSLRARVAGSGA
jgi:hypothetical protein